MNEWLNAISSFSHEDSANSERESSIGLIWRCTFGEHAFTFGQQFTLK